MKLIGTENTNNKKPFQVKITIKGRNEEKRLTFLVSVMNFLKIQRSNNEKIITRKDADIKIPIKYPIDSTFLLYQNLLK